MPRIKEKGCARKIMAGGGGQVRKVHGKKLKMKMKPDGKQGKGKG